jgi:plastocyanin
MHPRLIQSGIAASFFALTTLSHAVTTLVGPSRYSVTEGVAFTLGNTGLSDFTFNWTDPSGAPALSSVNIADPTLILTLGQTYTFQRTTGAHPFAIMDGTASTFISGADGSYSRTSSGGITVATLFTASPAPGNTISWTPTQAGDFWYTCTVASHPDMTGKITVIPEPSAFGLIAGGFAFAAFRRRRGIGLHRPV